MPLLRFLKTWLCSLKQRLLPPAFASLQTIESADYSKLFYRVKSGGCFLV